MKKKPSSNQALLARERLAERVNHAGAALLTNVPMAMSGLPDAVRLSYLALTAAAAALHIATGAAIWVVLVKLKA